MTLCAQFGRIAFALVLLPLIVACAGCANSGNVVESEVRSADLVFFNNDAWRADQATVSDSPKDAQEQQGKGYWWYAACYCNDAWWSGPYRYQDQAERSAAQHNCDHHWCVHCADVAWRTEGSDGALQATSTRCTNTACCYFQQEVPPGHQHSFRCSDTGCCYFQQCVPPGHKHWFRCSHTGCCYFQQCVPPDHGHWLKCSSVSCVYFQQCVPPDHKHTPKRAAK